MLIYKRNVHRKNESSRYLINGPKNPPKSDRRTDYRVASLLISHTLFNFEWWISYFNLELQLSYFNFEWQLSLLQFRMAAVLLQFKMAAVLLQFRRAAVLLKGLVPQNRFELKN